MKVSSALSVLCLIVLISVAVLANENHRNDKLFQLFPLHKSMNSLYSKFFSGSESTRSANDQNKIHVFKDEVKKSLSNIKEIESKQIAQFLKEFDALDENGKYRAGNKPQEVRETLFHNYNANAVVLYGTADFGYVRDLLKKEGEDYEPIALGNSDKTMVTLWIVDHKDTSMGKHKELFVTVHVSKKEKGQILGVSYEEGNLASLLYPVYGKLPNHSRLYVLHSTVDNDNKLLRAYKREVHGFPTNEGVANIEKIEKKMNTRGYETSFYKFKFSDTQGNLLVKGEIEEDNTWNAWYESTYKIFKALGLSAILDLFHSTHVTVKMAGRKSVSPRLTKLQMDMKQSIYDIKDYTIEFGQNTEFSTQMRGMNFKPEMVVRMPQFQYALSSTIHTDSDKEYLEKNDLKFEGKEQ